MQITGAMKMVSAAKLKKAKNALSKVRPYAEKIEDLLALLSSDGSLEGISRYFQEIKGKPQLIIAMSSNRGLCGGFNASVARELTSQVSSLDSFCLITIGKKIKDALGGRFPIYQDRSALLDALSYPQVSLFCDELIDGFLQGSFHSIHLLYNKFKNAALQQLTTEQILPIAPREPSDELHANYLMEPSRIPLLKNIIPKKVKISLFNAILESHAAEQGARTSAMHKATDNASSLKGELLLTYNKARQAAITAEILEIAGGAEALHS